MSSLTLTRGGATSRVTLGLLLVATVIIAALPWILGVGGSSRAVALLVYILLAVMWNALAGFAGLVSIGQTLFFGVAAYATIRLADAGIDPFVAIVLATLIGALLGYLTSFFMLSLSGGEFAIGMWVLSSLAHLCVNLDPLIQGETGTSLIALNAYENENARDADAVAGPCDHRGDFGGAGSAAAVLDRGGHHSHPRR